MLFVVDKPRLQRIISIVRDDRTSETQADDGPFLRLEANDDRLKLAGKEVEAEFSATVYEPGVLFLRVTLFRRLLKTMTVKQLHVRYMTFQVNSDGLTFGDVHMPFDAADMLLYPDVHTAPQEHPEKRLAVQEEAPRTRKDPQGELFEDL